MSRVKRLAAAPVQLVGALRRNGVSNVWRFGAAFVSRHGLRQALRYAIAPQALRLARLVELEQEDDPVKPHIAAPQGDFAADGSVAASQFGALITAARPPPGGKAGAEGVHVVRGRPEPPAGAEARDWVVLLAEGDVASPKLAELVATAGAASHVEVISFDFSYALGVDRVAPVIQPGATPWLARYADVGFGRYAFRAAALRGVAGDGYVQLRSWLAARTLADARDRWIHLSEPLVRAKMTAGDVERARSEAVARARSDLQGAGVAEQVSVVICTHNRGRLLRQLVRTLDDPRIADVTVVANNTTSPPARETLEWVRDRPRCRVLVDDAPFNFSRMCNTGAATGRGDRLLFLNDDITPVSDDWLEPLLQPLRDDDVGVTGALLLYPDEAVQHAGIFLGYRGGAGHNLRHVRLPEQDYLFYGAVPREVSAVTGAVMMARRDAFEALNGFDELLPTFLQDVDLCLRMRAVGMSTIWTPFAELIHMESASMKQSGGVAFQHALRSREHARFLGRWGDALAQDPLRSPLFDAADESQRTLAVRPRR